MPSKGSWSRHQGCGIEQLGTGCCPNAFTTANAISILRDTAIGETLLRGLVNCRTDKDHASRGIGRVKSHQSAWTPGLAPGKGARGELWEVEEAVVAAAGDAGANE